MDKHFFEFLLRMGDTTLSCRSAWANGPATAPSSKRTWR